MRRWWVLVGTAILATGCGSSTATSSPALTDPVTTATATTTTLPVTTTAPPHITVTITGDDTTEASLIDIDVDNQQTQHSDVPLPVTYDLGPYNQFGDLVSAQNSSQAAGTSITCTIRFHNGIAAPVTDTATGPYAITECNSMAG